MEGETKTAEELFGPQIQAQPAGETKTAEELFGVKDYAPSDATKKEQDKVAQVTGHEITPTGQSDGVPFVARPPVEGEQVDQSNKHPDLYMHEETTKFKTDQGEEWELGMGKQVSETPSMWDSIKKIAQNFSNPEEEQAKVFDSIVLSKMFDAPGEFSYNFGDVARKQIGMTEGIKGLIKNFEKDFSVGIRESNPAIAWEGKEPNEWTAPSRLDSFVKMGVNMFASLPEFFAGTALSGGLGGGFALVAADRAILIDSYRNGEVKDFKDFTERGAGILWEGTKGYITGEAMGLAGKIPGPNIAKRAYELTAMTVAGSALNGEIPKVQDFIDNAALFTVIGVGGKAKDYAVHKSMNAFKTFDIHPEVWKESIRSRLRGVDEETAKLADVLDAIDSFDNDLKEATTMRTAVRKDGVMFAGKGRQSHDEVMKDNNIAPDEAHERGFILPGKAEVYASREQAKDYVRENYPDIYKNWVDISGGEEKGEFHSQDYYKATDAKAEKDRGEDDAAGRREFTQEEKEKNKTPDEKKTAAALKEDIEKQVNYWAAKEAQGQGETGRDSLARIIEGNREDIIKDLVDSGRDKGEAEGILSDIIEGHESDVGEFLPPEDEPVALKGTVNIVKVPFGGKLPEGTIDGHRYKGKDITNTEPGERGSLGNPFKANDVAGGKLTRPEAVAAFKKVFLERINSDPAYRDYILSLRGKDIGYYKPEETNHLQVVKDWLAGEGKDTKAGIPRDGALSSVDKDGNIKLKEGVSVVQLHKYLKGESGESSEQKKAINESLLKQGIDVTKLITNTSDAKKFLTAHEQSHIDNKDSDVYWENGKDLMTPDKLAIEERAIKDALNVVGKTKAEPLDNEPERFSAFADPTGEPKRTVGDVLKDVKDALGEKGAVGDIELTEEQKAARERLGKDVEALKASAKKAGMELEAWLRSKGLTNEQIKQVMALAGANKQGEDKKPEEQRSDPYFKVEDGPIVNKVPEETAGDFLWRAYEKHRDIWFEDKDVNKFRAGRTAKEHRDTLIDALGVPNPFTFRQTALPGNSAKRKFVTDHDAAMQLFIELQYNPEAIAKWKGEKDNKSKNIDEQNKLIELAQNLPPKVQALVNRMRTEYDELYKASYDAELVKNYRRNFANRVWNNPVEWQRGDEGKIKNLPFKLKTRHELSRIYDTILEGWADGQTLKVSGAIDNLRLMKEEIHNTIANKEMMDSLSKIVDINGRKVLMSDAQIGIQRRKVQSDIDDWEKRSKAKEIVEGDDYIKNLRDSLKSLDGMTEIENHNFMRFDHKGKIEAASTERQAISKAELRAVLRDMLFDSGKPAEEVVGKVKEVLVRKGWTDKEADNIISKLKAREGAKRQEFAEKSITDTLNREINKELDIKQYGKDFFINPNGDIYVKSKLFAPETIAHNLNNILGVSAIAKYKVFHDVAKYNSLFKTWVLQSNFFHNLAFARNYYLGTSGHSWKDLNPFTAHKIGLKAMNGANPLADMLIKHGMTQNLRQDWEANLANEQTVIGDILDKWGTSKRIKDKILNLQKCQVNFLFGDFGAGLKMHSGLLEMNRLMKKNPGMDVEAIAKQVAELENYNYGGIHLERIGRNKTFQSIAHIVTLAPDWSESNLQLMKHAFEEAGPSKAKELHLYQNLVAKWYVKSLGGTVLWNLLMAGGDIDEMVDNYAQAWKDGNLNWMRMNMTPIYKLFGGTGSNRKYFALTGHMEDPIKMVIEPGDFVRNKSSIIGRDMYDAISGRNYLGKRFATFGEFIDKGELTQWGGTAHGLNFNNFLPFVITETIGTQPVQLQNLIGWANGDQEWFDAISNSAGLGMRTTHDRKFRKDR